MEDEMSLFMLMILALVSADAQPAEVAAVPPADADAGKIVCTVDGRDITVGAFVEAYKNRLANVTPDKYPPMKNLGQARAFLDDLITIQAILVSALNEGYDKKPDFIKEYNSFEENTLIQALMDEETKGFVVTEEEAKAFYDKTTKTRLVRYIMTANLEDAQKVVAEARKKGADFGKLAKQYSIDPVAKENGGKLGEPLQYWPSEPFVSIFKLPLGVVSEPLELPNEAGWGVFIVDEELPNTDLQSWDEMKEYYINQLKAIHTNEVRERLADQAYKDAKIERNQQNMEILYSGDTTPDDWFKKDISELVVSTVDGLPITFREWYGSAIFYLNNIIKLRKEQPEQLRKAMEHQLRVVEKGKALLALCYQRKIQDLPDVAEALKNYRERELTFAYLKDNVEDKIPAPTEEQIKTYYEAHKNDEDYQLVENLDATIIRGNKKVYVEDTVARLQKGEDLDTVIYDINRKAGVKIDDPVITSKPDFSPVVTYYNQNFLVTNNEQRDQYNELKSLGEGNWSAVEERDGVFYAARLDKLNLPRAKTLEEARSVITSKLSDEIHLDPKTDKMCRDILKKIHDRYPIKVFNNVLELARKEAAAVPLPKPPTEESIRSQEGK
jgi:peptidyl-prolyl cis-trans isomerase C